jgi:phosphohistidine phosphatase
MKTLHLLRHAKSSWKDASLDDHERPLAKRGRKNAKVIAAYLQHEKIAPDLVICSTAARARQTLAPIAKKIKPSKVIFERGIYEVSERKLWKYLWNLPNRAECVLLIGHNPGLHNLALALADPASQKGLPPREGKFATGALATFCFDGTWNELRPGGVAVAAFTTPKAMSD